MDPNIVAAQEAQDAATAESALYDESYEETLAAAETGSAPSNGQPKTGGEGQSHVAEIKRKKDGDAQGVKRTRQSRASRLLSLVTGMLTRLLRCRKL
jgi:hypothetical protein